MFPLFLGSDVHVKIADFGEAFLWTGVPAAVRLGVPISYAAPEVPFLDGVGLPSDIWTLCCTMFEILSGNMVFCADGVDTLLRDITFTLGKLPDRWWVKWEKRAENFSDDAVYVGRREILDLQARLQELSMLEPDDRAALEKMVHAMLRVEPGERICAGEVVQMLPAVWI